MSARFAIQIGCVLAALYSQSAMAQVPRAPVVGAAIEAFPGTSSVAFSEPAIVVSPLNPDHVAVICNKTVLTGTVHPGIACYELSTCGFCTIPTLTAFPAIDPNPDNNLQDPMVTVSPTTGDLYIGGSNWLGVWLTRAAAGGTTVDSPVAAAHFESSSPWIEGKDKPFMATGVWAPQDPNSHTLGESVRVGYAAFDSGQDPIGLRFCHSIDGDVIGMSWAEDGGVFGAPKHVDADGSSTPADSEGNGAFPVVLPSGRVVMGWVGNLTSDPSSTTAYVAYTDGGGDYGTGRRWQQASHLNFAGSTQIYGAPLHSHDILLAAEISLAADPANSSTTSTNVVMAAFTGRTDTNDENTDIFVARSSDGGATFPATDTVQITDELLESAGVGPGNSAEYHPSIVIDSLGGINLLIGQVYDGAKIVVNNVWYLRWPSFTSLANGDTPFAENLTPSGMSIWPYFAPKRAGNDYHMLTGRCTLFAAYASNETSHWSVYVRRIEPFDLSLCASGRCYANCDGSTQSPILNTHDFTCFLTAFAAAQDLSNAEQITNYANCDGSTASPAVNVQDFTCYLQRYTSGCP